MMTCHTVAIAARITFMMKSAGFRTRGAASAVSHDAYSFNISQDG